MSTTLSAADRRFLTGDQQKQIQSLKQAWADANAAGDKAAMARANQQAETIRATAGYAGGSDGSGYRRLDGSAAPAPVAGAGRTAQEVQQWVDDYESMHYRDGQGWINGYSTAMNVRSMANYIRQQMEANSNAWSTADAEGRAYLHAQNQELAEILRKASGGAQSTYNEKLGRWETANANLGYGYDVGQYLDRDWYRNAYGMTDEQMDAYASDVSRYHNFVDQNIIRNWTDESSGYTGMYAQFVNGPYGQLLSGTQGVDPSVYTNLQGDGFDDEHENYEIPRNADGTIAPKTPALKNNNSISDYTRQFTAYVEDGVIQPGMLSSRAKSPTGVTGGRAHSVTGSGSGGSGFGSSGADSSLLDRWQTAAGAQAVAQRDYAVDKAVQQLLKAQAQAETSFQTQRDQIARDERNALDNSALYAEARGDRGGIGHSQYNQILAQAAANRQTVNTAQAQMAADTNQQIIQLRAEGRFQAADDLLEIAQTYLLKLLDLEQWAAEYALDTKKFEASVEKWQQQYRLQLAKLMLR